MCKRSKPGGIAEVHKCIGNRVIVGIDQAQANTGYELDNQGRPENMFEHGLVSVDLESHSKNDDHIDYGKKKHPSGQGL